MATCLPADGADPLALVAQRVLRARVRLALQQPFLASALMRLPLRAAPDMPWCPTAATDGYHIFYNPQWVATLSDSELRGLLAHEVLHVLFAHAGRRNERMHEAWNVACDYVINALLLVRGFKLPKGGLFNVEAQNKTAEQVYAEIEQRVRSMQEEDKRKRRKPSAARLREALRGGGGHSTAAAQRRLTGSHEADPLADTVPEMGHDLLLPHDPRTQGLRSPDAPDDEQLQELQRELRTQALERLRQEDQQARAGLFAQECRSDERRRVDWRALLHTHLNDFIKGDWSSYPFSKRMVHRGLFMPSPQMRAPHHVVFAIDTSGSMSAVLLVKVMSEIRAFRETFACRLSVIQCDSVIQSVLTLEAMDGGELPENFTAHGRGGTDFRPVFKWVDEHAPGCLLIYATDGHGTFPEQAQDCSVLWLMTTADDQDPAVPPFGAVVSLHD